MQAIHVEVPTSYPASDVRVQQPEHVLDGLAVESTPGEERPGAPPVSDTRRQLLGSLPLGSKRGDRRLHVRGEEALRVLGGGTR